MATDFGNLFEKKILQLYMGSVRHPVCPTDSLTRFCMAKNFNSLCVCLLPLSCCCNYCLEKKSLRWSALLTETTVNFSQKTPSLPTIYVLYSKQT